MLSSIDMSVQDGYTRKAQGCILLRKDQILGEVDVDEEVLDNISAVYIDI